MKSHYNIIFFICIATYFILGLLIVFLSDPGVGDENWHFAASSLVAQGKVPYRDFAYFHMPLVPYVYGLAMYIFGSNLIVGRLLSFLLVLLTIILIYKTALRLKDSSAGIFAVLFTVFNFHILHFSTVFFWAPLANFLLSLFCFTLTSKAKPVIRYSIATSLLVLVEGTRYALDYMSVYTLLFITFIIYLNIKNKKVIYSVILSYIGTSLLIYLPGLLSAPKSFLFGTLTHYFSKLSLGKSIGTTYPLSIFIYDRIKMILRGMRHYYLINLSLLLMGIYCTYYLFYSIKRNKLSLSSLLSQYKIYFILALLVIFNELFHWAILGFGLGIHPYYVFPVEVILIGCALTRISEKLETLIKKQLFTFSISLIVILNLFTHDIESVINSPQYAGIKFLNQVSQAIQRNTKPQDKVFSFMNGYVLQAHRQIFVDTIYEVSGTGFFPTMPDRQAEEYKLLNAKKIISYFKERKAKVVVIERPGRLESYLLAPWREEIEDALFKNYSIVEKIYKYPEGTPGPVVYIYYAK